MLYCCRICHTPTYLKDAKGKGQRAKAKICESYPLDGNFDTRLAKV